MGDRVDSAISLVDRNDVNWEGLKICLAISRAGSLSGAAQKMGVSHTTLQRRVDSLERALGVSLFRRKSTGYELNSAGLRLVEAAAGMEPLLTEALKDIGSSDENMSGSIRFFVPEVSSKMLFNYIREFQAQYPQIFFRFEKAHDPNAITSRDADVAVVLTNEAPMGQRGVPIGPVGFAAYVRRDFRDLALKGSLPWLGVTDDLSHSAIGKLENQFSQQFSVVNRCGEFILRGHAIQSGLGVGLLACGVGEHDPSLIRISKVVVDPRLTLWLLHRKELVGNHRVMTFFRHMKLRLIEDRDGIEGNTVQSVSDIIAQ